MLFQFQVIQSQSIYLNQKKVYYNSTRYLTGPNGKNNSQNLLGNLEKEMATYFSILAWKIPWTEKLGGLQSRGLPCWTRLSTAHNQPSVHRTMCAAVSTGLVFQLITSRAPPDHENMGTVGTTVTLLPSHLIPGHPHLGKQGPRVSSDGRTHRSLQ